MPRRKTRVAVDERWSERYRDVGTETAMEWMGGRGRRHNESEAVRQL